MLLIMTNDRECHLAAQLVSSRMPTLVNVVAGMMTAGDDPNSKMWLSTTTSNHISPTVLAADRLCPINWDLLYPFAS